MESFKQIIAVLTSVSLVLAFVQAYLQVNKCWGVRHERSVANSISVSSNLIGLLPVTLSTIDLCLSREWRGAISCLLALSLTIFYTTLGLGWWVENERKKGVFRLLKKALWKEREHLGDFAKALFVPNGANRIIEVLSRIAMIDQDLDDREKAFIQTFATSWGIKLNWNDMEKWAGNSQQDNYIQLRHSISEYLSTTPSKEQVSQLSDVLNRLANVDGQMSAQEELIISELCGMLAGYVNGADMSSRYEVNIVPQSEEQVSAISAVLTDAQKHVLESGVVFSVGPFFSQHYANMMRDQYRALGFFSVSTQVERSSRMERVAV